MPPADGPASVTRYNGSAGQPVRVLDVDPELGRHLAVEARARARDICLAREVSIAPGEWIPEFSRDQPSAIFALLVVDGIVCRETATGARSIVELLVAGDVVPPTRSVAMATDAHDMEPMRPQTGLTVLSALTIVVLANSFLGAAARWPGLLVAVQERLALQQTRLATQSLALQFPQARERILLTLWLLGQRCGRVTADGLALPFELTHSALARMTGSRRPTVSLAMKSLSATGHILIGDECTTLTERARRDLIDLTASDAHSSPAAAGLRMRPPSVVRH